MVCGVIETLNAFYSSSHSMAQLLDYTQQGGVQVGNLKWRNIKCNSCKFANRNLPFQLWIRHFLIFVFYDASPVGAWQV